MGSIHVHEFISLDGVIDTPVWTAGYGFVPEMGRVLGEAFSNGVVYLNYRAHP